ncbi:unnamed protein product [Owenia fusiformis]|uniref:Abasic site processing protein HMCES n=1 Tax=Owenia fusiformis TaxID=6347 RepID=A0A8J1V0G0_OWEFU|nr:unnamed protein product [Owenia fusiformis]
MCGRTVCMLAPEDVCRACTHRNKQGKKTKPQWRDAPGGQQYNTSYNMSPGSHTPVLISSQHFDSVYEGEKCESERLIQPMHWGLIPPWSSDPKSAGYSMSNCRSESMLEKRSFKIPLQKGQRCVVLANGYFEWQTDKISGKKQPFYIYTLRTGDQNKEKNNKDIDTTKKAKEDSMEGEKLLCMAGVFEKWTPKGGGEPLFSYSVITVESSPSMQKIHHRMPAILATDEEVQDWLDTGDVPLSKAVKLCRATETLQFHPVSSMVNNSRNNDPECIKPFDLKKQQAKDNASKNFMMGWLNKKKKATDGEIESNQPDSKKRKIEQTDINENT